MFIHMDENHPCWKRAIFRNPKWPVLLMDCVLFQRFQEVQYIVHNGEDMPSTSSVLYIYYYNYIIIYIRSCDSCYSK